MNATFFTKLWSLIGALAVGYFVIAGNTFSSKTQIGKERLRTRAIESLRIGDRVVAFNPDQSNCTLSVLNGSLSIISLRLPGNAANEYCDIQLLRSEEWLELTMARRLRCVWLTLPELGLEGMAEVCHIEPAQEFPTGTGELVTGIFVREGARLVDLSVDGLQDPIGVTENHLFWSEDRCEFVRVRDLKPQERLRGLKETCRVVSLSPREGRHRVYNLEVNSQHVYHVTSLGILVHNNCGVGAYSAVGGHHIHAKVAFEGVKGYSEARAISVSKTYMTERKWNHQAMTNRQRELFRELRESGRANTLTEHNAIAVQALMAGGATEEEARALTALSLLELRREGVTAPSRIPWTPR